MSDQNNTGATQVDAEKQKQVDAEKAKVAAKGGAGKKSRAEVMADPRCVGEDGEPLPLSYPKKFKKGEKGHGDMKQMIANWVDQKKAFCGEIDRCYYPLVEKREPTTNEVITRKTAQGTFVVGECSFDPRHAGGEQLFKKPNRSNKPEEAPPDEE